jgi:hypothetical protein
VNRRWLILIGALSGAACSDIPANHDTAERCGCVKEAVRLSQVEPPADVTTTVTPCRTFSLEVGAVGDRPAKSCSMPMMCPAQMGGGSTDAAPQVNGGDIAQAIAHPDVQAAVRAGPVRYGDGPGPVREVLVHRIDIGPANFEVGAPCFSSSCTPIPDGVQALEDLLFKVQAQEKIRSPCLEALR